MVSLLTFLLTFLVGGLSSSKNSKCQDLNKSEFLGGRGLFCSSQNSKCQDLPKLEFSRGRGGGGVLYQIPEQGVLANLVKISGSLACLCITDSLSHTTNAETNNEETEELSVKINLQVQCSINKYIYIKFVNLDSPPTKFRKGNVFSRVCLDLTVQTTLLVIFGSHHWRPVQTCLLQDPLPFRCWHLVAIDAMYGQRK